MKGIFLYPTLTPEMADSAGLDISPYRFSYSYQGEEYPLEAKGSATIKLTDPLDIWNIETEGLIIHKELNIAYPKLLHGSNGIACEDAQLGICIIWTNKAFPQTGYINPVLDELDEEGWDVTFHHSFPPGTIVGDLELELVFYIKEKAKEVGENEKIIINETGVTVGEIQRVVLDFNNLFMEFPIEEFKSSAEPLWWVEFSEWEDPTTIDLFGKESFCLYLNPYYEACPVPSVSDGTGSIKNIDLLIDILAQTYFLILKRLSDEDLKATINGTGLGNNTVCSILHYFVERCDDLHWETDERLLKSLQINLRKMILGD